jgi:protein SCO1/2
MKPGVVAALVGGVVVVGLGAVALVPRLAAPHGGTGTVLTIGGPFKLDGARGKTVTDQDFRGRYMLVYFGYTHCPDACPTTLTDLAQALDQLPAADRAKAVPIFITVDPARDTPQVMADYARAFGPQFIGLSGSPAAIKTVADEFRVYAAKHPLKGGDYAVDHSSVIYVMGTDGAFIGVIPSPSSPADIADRLKEFGV